MPEPFARTQAKDPDVDPVFAKRKSHQGDSVCGGHASREPERAQQEEHADVTAMIFVHSVVSDGDVNSHLALPADMPA